MISNNKVNKNKRNKKINKSENFFVKGIYFLYQGNKIVYIGQSKSNVMQRICDHYNDNSKIFDGFNFHLKDDLSNKQIDHLERHLIKKFKPKYNTIYNNPEKPLSRIPQNINDINYKETPDKLKRKLKKHPSYNKC